MSDWRNIAIEELCSQITSGGTPNRSRPDYYSPAEIPWVKTAELAEAYIRDAEEYISREGLNASSAKLLPRGTVLVAMYGATAGRVGILGIEAACNQASCALIANPDVALDRWLFYALVNQSENLVDIGANGAAQQNLSARTIRRFPISTPPIGEQRAVAEILGALDDKIEANRKLAATAEALARSCYAVAVSDLPRNRMSETLEPRLGATPRRSNDDYWGGGHPWVSVKDVTAAASGLLLDTDESISDLAISETRARPIPAGSVVLTARGTVGRVARLAVPASFNQSCYAFVPDGLSPALLYFAVRDAADSMRGLAHGSVFDTITTKTFDHVEIPDIRCVSADQAARIESVLVAVENAARQNRLLATLRDTLLPKLMSGQLRVREAMEVAAL